MNIEAKMWSGCEQINITGGKLRSKFSIHQKPDGYHATSAKGNSELIQFLDGLKELGEKYEESNISYYWWKIKSSEVIFVMNAVIRKFE